MCMSKNIKFNHEELIGCKFDKLSVIKLDGKIGHEIAYLCKCDCGNCKRVRKGSLKSKITTSCGCNKKYKDMLGLNFGKWKVKSYSHKNEKGLHYWNCECQCENKTLKKIEGATLRAKRSLSCGCSTNKTHGMSDTKIYKIWDGMRYRCNKEGNQNYSNYGGRGIKVCEEWNSPHNGFLDFYRWSLNNGYEEGLSIDRIDNDGNYEPSNCRWVDMKIQGNNKRNNVYYEYNGEIKTVTEWANTINIDSETFRKRLNYGMTIEEALTKELTIQVRDRIIEIGEISDTLMGWSDRTGINISTLRVRYSQGKRGNELIKITKNMKLKGD